MVRVVGLGPAGAELMTQRTLQLIRSAALVRLRTHVHPAAAALGNLTSYDEWYEKAPSFESLYVDIVDDLVNLALTSPNGEVLYVVPGSPTVAERTVELLRDRPEVLTICEPAVSVIDVACAALGRDPMSDGLRVVDALSSSESLRGPGPLLVLQTFAPEVLATVASRLPATCDVQVLHHVGLEDEVITTLKAEELATFDRADHLTSLWIDELRTAGDATDDLVDLMRRLRRDCPWDQEQDHASLRRHLLEEAYEVIDALGDLMRAQASGESLEVAGAHVREELGDLWFQVIFHAELGDEEDLFTLTTIADAVREKLIGRHPHVFGDVQVSGSHEVASRWEAIKQEEKGRESITDGIAWQLPALTLYANLLSKAAHVDLARMDASMARAEVIEALRSLDLDGDDARDVVSRSEVDEAWGNAVSALVICAQHSGVDLEDVLRSRARLLRDDIRVSEQLKKA